MKNTIDVSIRRTQAYWYMDGLAEIAVGLFFVVMSLYFLVQARIKTLSINPALANFILLIAILLVLWGFRQALQAVKARLTYPRTGYVAAPHMQKSSRWQRYGMITWLALVCISLIVLALNSHTAPSWMSLLIGIVAGLTVLALGYRFRLLRFVFVACVLVLIGAGLSFLNPGQTLTMFLSSAAGGVCFIVSGGVALVHYLHGTQPPAEANL